MNAYTSLGASRASAAHKMRIADAMNTMSDAIPGLIFDFIEVGWPELYYGMQPGNRIQPSVIINPKDWHQCDFFVNLPHVICSAFVRQ